MATNIWTMFYERGFIRPDIEMLGRLNQEKDSTVVGKLGQRRPTLLCVKQGSAGVPEHAVGLFHVKWADFQKFPRTSSSDLV